MYEFHQFAAPEGTRNLQVHVTADGSKSTLWTRLEFMEGDWEKCGQKPLEIYDPTIDIIIRNGALRGGRAFLLK